MNVSRLKRCNETRLMESEAGSETLGVIGSQNGDGKFLVGFKYFHVHPLKLGKIPILTHILQRG